MARSRTEVNILCTLSENIRNMRLKKGYTQNVLAALMEVDPETIYNYESGKYAPIFSNLAKLIDALEVTPNDILCEKRELTPEEAMQFNVEIPKPPAPPPRKRVRFRPGEEPDVATEMKDIMIENRRMREESRNRRKERRRKKSSVELSSPKSK